MIFVFLWLTSLRIISRSIHVAANGIASFFLWLSNIPLYIGTKTSSPIPLLIGCFHVLASVNGATVKKGVHVSTLPLTVGKEVCFLFVRLSVVYTHFVNAHLLFWTTSNTYFAWFPVFSFLKLRELERKR